MITGKLDQTKVVKTQPYLELKNQGQVIRFELNSQQHCLGRNQTQCDLLIPENWRVISGIHAIFRRQGDEYWVYDGDGEEPSTNGLFVNHTRITTTEGYRLLNGVELKIGQNPTNQVRIRYFNSQEPNHFNTLTPASISLKNRSVLLGRDPQATLQLDSPLVSRRHAMIEPDQRGNYILYDYSSNGVWVNNQRVNQSIQLTNPATIRIGSSILIRRNDQLELCDTGNQIRLDAQRLLYMVKDKRGKTRVLLNDLTFAIEPGQFVALVGGSGAGKSTLMRTLLGIQETTKGKVYINGEDLRKNYNLYRNQIGYVPQDDIIHPNLTVREVLTYAAQLRLPPDHDINAVVYKTLCDIEMVERQDVLVRQLSGGQRKRVSIGVELLADPKLFFLDEPTSGLDPGLDKKMMQLLRKLANQGRTIILVTHATANISMCDRIVFLGRGGRLCYFGSPQEAFNFFQIQSEDFADIYNLLEEGEGIAQNWSLDFRKSPYYQRYILNHLSFDEFSDSKSRFIPSFKPSRWGYQLSILTQRYLKLTLRDPVNLGLNLLTAPLGIALIRLAIRNQEPFTGDANLTLASLAKQVLFVFTCAAIWVGLSSSLQEIVKEAAIYLRERLVNLGLFPYLVSKVSVLSGLAALQTFLMVLVILIGFQAPESNLITWSIGISITSFLTLMSCMGLGLLISALVKNSSQANSALPLILLPQIIFSGVLFKMEGLSRILSWFMLSRWSMGAYGILVDLNSRIPEPVKLPDGTLLKQALEPTSVYSPTWENLGFNWAMLLLHFMVYMVLTLMVQKRKDLL